MVWDVVNDYGRKSPLIFIEHGAPTNQRGFSIGILAMCATTCLVVQAEHGKHSRLWKEHHHPAYYKYGYKVHDDYHGTDFGHNEHRDGHVTKGEYHVKLPDGRVQTVTYYVDGYKGYVAEVKYHGKAHHPHVKPHKGYGHDHGHDHGHGHGGHSEVYGHQKPGHGHGHHKTWSSSRLRPLALDYL
ncbi:kininogen-1-like [Tigriopus californicus]|uniref:kininogen-1-like n=1 Tax=Tigriopus californicus TaxID=6832 RepID=UPI0027DA9BA4|nr:kininogen-1-like [Tigriopus californicus]